MNDRLDTPIEDLNLSIRAYNCLRRGGLMTVRQILEKTEDELLALRNFGRKSYDEVIDKLIELGFLDASVARWPADVDGTENAAQPGDESRVMRWPARPTWPAARERMMSAAIEEVADHGYPAMAPAHLLVALLRQPEVQTWLLKLKQLPSVDRARAALHEALPPDALSGSDAFLLPATRSVLDQLEDDARPDLSPEDGYPRALRLVLARDARCRGILRAAGIDVGVVERSGGTTV